MSQGIFHLPSFLSVICVTGHFEPWAWSMSHSKSLGEWTRKSIREGFSALENLETNCHVVFGRNGDWLKAAVSKPWRKIICFTRLWEATPTLPTGVHFHQRHISEKSPGKTPKNLHHRSKMVNFFRDLLPTWCWNPCSPTTRQEKKKKRVELPGTSSCDNAWSSKELVWPRKNISKWHFWMEVDSLQLKNRSC